MKKLIQSLTLIIIFIFFNQINLMAESNLIHYVSMEKPNRHYFQVQTDIIVSESMQKNGFAEVKMAVWTPGSYLVREFSRNIESLTAKISNKAANVDKMSKNTWRVNLKNARKGDKISVSYQVYAFEQSVRTSILDDSHGYINPASVFLYVEEYKNQSIDLIINPYKGFTRSSSAMKEIKEHHFQARNLDEFIDSPIEIGNHEVLRFDMEGIPHEIAFYGPAEVDRVKFVEDVKRVCLEAKNVFKTHPCDHYLFIIHNYERGGGGLEHLNSTTCEVSRSSYESINGYHGILNLLAHEYFHLWNVKRLRPEALGPFDYENENYTHHLWLSEGFTSYYANYITWKAGFIPETDFLKETASNIAYVENMPGNYVQTVAEASFDAWIKYYRPNENSRNATISYYSKGEVLGTFFNLWILKNSKGQKNLNDLMQYLYQTTYVEKSRGFTDQEVMEAFSYIAGKSAKEIFKKNIFGLEWPDFKGLFNDFGFELKDKNENNQDPYLGLFVRSNEILSIMKDGPADLAGLSVQDKINQVNGLSWEEFNKNISNQKPGEEVIFNVTRDGINREFKAVLMANPNKSYELLPILKLNKQQELLKKAWLN